MNSRMATVFLVGPTAVGKTAVALELAVRLKAEIVSVDSMQIYRGMDIGTAKPTPAECERVPHHLVDICDVGEVFDAKRFVDLATDAIAGIHARGRTALVVGGTGMYVRALRQGLFEGAARDPKLRARLEAMSAAELFAELERVDPATAGRIDAKNPRRLVRALEVFHATGKPISELQQQWAAARPCRRGPARGSDKPDQRAEGAASRLAATMAIGLNRDRAELVARIERRIEEQMRAGWLDEVRRLTLAGTALQATGYKELAAHLRGELTLPAAVELIKVRTRQLAKRQITWFRREPELSWVVLEPDETPSMTAARIEQLLPGGDAAR